MFPVVTAELIALDCKRFTVHAPRIAAAWKVGQFVIVRVYEQGERIPLTIVSADPMAGTIDLIVQGVGKTTRLLNTLGAGDSILDVVGPLGTPSQIQDFGTVAVIGGGVGTAIAYPVAVAMKSAGNHVISVIGARSRDRLILESEMRAASDELFVMTDDGSYGEHGVVTDCLARLLERKQRAPSFVLAVGPIPMMRAVADVTRPRAVRTVVSLNPIMVDGTGMCGGCRVLVGSASRFACVDGPEFDAHLVNFEVLQQRNAMYRDVEQDELHQWLASGARDRRDERLTDAAVATGAPQPECRLERTPSQPQSDCATPIARPRAEG